MFKTLKRVFSYARPYLAYFVMTLLFAALGVSLSLAVPVFIGNAVDCCVGKGQVDFEKLGKEDPFFARLDGLCKANHGLWSAEAEKYLLETKAKD